MYRTSQNDNERNTTLVEQTAALSRMTAELKQAYKVVGPVSGSTSNYMDVLIRITRPSGTQDRRVLYRCDNTSFSTGLQQCLRYEFAATDPSPAGTPPASATGTLVIRGSATAPPGTPCSRTFSSPSGTTGGPTYGKATIKTPGRGERATGYQHQITLSDGFYMRNRDLAH